MQENYLIHIEGVATTDGDSETVDLTTTGAFYKKDDKYYVCYNESAATGFDGSKLCECHIDLLKKLAFEDAGKKSPLKFCSFDDFRLDYYSEEKIEKLDISPKEMMKGILAYCVVYAG